jgi:hypothetical protein
MHNSFGVAGTYDHAGDQLALRDIRKHVDEMHREFLGRVVKHHQVGKLPDQFLFIRLDLNLHLLATRLRHGTLVDGDRARLAQEIALQER